MSKPSRPLGPVHLYPERPKTLQKGDNVAHATHPRLWGRVTNIPPHRVGAAPLYEVAWEDGSVATYRREELLSRFTTETPRERRAA